MSIIDLKKEIDARHGATIGRRSQEGNIRALELLWGKEMRDSYNLPTPPFTAQMRGNLRHLIKEYGSIAKYISRIIRQWSTVRRELNLFGISPHPYFPHFFIHRAMMISHLQLAELDTSEQQRKIAILSRKEGNNSSAGNRPSLTEMVKEERRKIYERQSAARTEG